MLIDFISTIAVGVSAAGIIFILRHLSGWRVAKWVLPAGVGLAMLGFSIWNEYTWFSRVQAQLPQTVVMATAPQQTIFYRPWTYAFPLVNRFVAVDKTDAKTSASDPDLFVASAIVAARWGRSQRIDVAFDCAKGTRADLFGGATMADDGSLTGAEWRTPDADDPLVRAACGGR